MLQTLKLLRIDIPCPRSKQQLDMILEASTGFSLEIPIAHRHSEFLKIKDADTFINCVLTCPKRFTEPKIKNLLAWSRGGVCVYLDRGGGGILQLGLSFRRCQKPKNKCCCPFGRCLLEVEVEGACGRWRWEEEVGRGGGRWRLEVGGLNKKGSGNGRWP